MKEAESKAIGASLTLEQLQAKIVAAQESFAGQQSAQRPKLSLEGSYRYQSEIPEVELGPTTLTLGQHNNYSIGPSLNYTLYDGGTDARMVQSLEHVLKARAYQKDEQIFQIKLAVRQLYAQLQAQMEELHLLDGMLRLTQARIKDIASRLILGASRLDLLSARREEDQLRLRFSQAQTALAQSISQLASLIGKKDLPNPLVPAAASLGRVAEGLPSPNFILELDPMDQTIGRLQTHAAAPDMRHPNLLRLHEQEAAMLAAAEAQGKEYNPTVKAFARSSYDYPNGPLAEHIWQNSVGISLSLPLYDAGTRRHAAAEKVAEARSLSLQREQLAQDRRDLWLKTQTQVHGLLEQKTIASSSAARARAVAEMIQANYKAGAATYLDVERAQFQVLEAETTLLRIRSQLIAALAVLNYLSSETTTP
jgi:outer membrane protein TolC